jgi:hypothetical protein
MAIVFQCTCGKPLRTQEQAAGKRTKCPHCGSLLTIPGGVPRPVPAGSPDPGASSLELDWKSIAVEQAAPSPPPPDLSRPDSALIKIDSMPGGDAVHLDLPAPGDGSTRQYKVLSQKDQGFTGKFNPVKLEEALNAHAQQGWVVKTASTVRIHGHGGDHDELIIILER